MRKVVLYIAMSVDGFIAGPGDNLDFLSSVMQEGEDYGYENFRQQIDTVIMGRKTYEKVISLGVKYPHADKTSFVISRSKSGKDENVEFRSDLPALIAELQSKPGKNIYCDGGGEIVSELLKHSLLDLIIISVIPHLVGEGNRLFSDDRPGQQLLLKKSEIYPSGLVQLWYEKKKD